MRARIVRAAWDCDYRTLGRLASQGADGFLFAGSIRGSPRRFWKRNDRCYDHLELMVRLLSVPFTIEDTPEEMVREGTAEHLYKWPSATAASATDEDWQALRRVYTGSVRLFKRWRENNDYQWFEVWISSEGDWVLFSDYWMPFDDFCPRRGK
jgi:hypothetical protein